MHFEFTFLEIAFRVTLFGLLAYKITGLVKSYIIPLLYDMEEQEHRAFSELVEKEKVLFSTQRKLEDQINQQKNSLILLEHKVSLWHDGVMAYKDLMDQEIILVDQRLDEKRKIQQRFFTASKVGEKIIPETIDYARRDLSAQYAGDSGEKLLHQMLGQLGKNKNF